MVDTSRELSFPFMAGSSVVVARRIPDVEMPTGAVVEEALCVAVGGIDGYDIHAPEAIQCILERRQGGETGVSWIQALKGDNVWKAMRAGSWDQGGWDMDLFHACLCRSHKLSPAREGYNHIYPSLDEIPKLVEQEPYLYRYQHADGTRVSMLLVEGLVVDFTFAARLKGQEKPLSTQMFLLPREIVNFFNPQVNAVEKMFLTGKPTYPVERTLPTTGLTAAGVESIYQGEERLETPHLNIQYQPTRESTYWRT